MTTVCAVPGCARPVGDAHACEPCRHTLDAALPAVPALVAELNAALARETNLAPSTGRGAAEHPLVVNLAAGAALARLSRTLRHWCGYVARQGGSGPQRAGQVIPRGWPATYAYAGWLLCRTEALRHTPAAGQAIDSIVGACHEGWKLVDGPTNRTTFAVGPCPQTDDDGCDCSGEVRAYIPRDPHTVATLTCGACGSVWWPWQWSRAGARILARQRQLRHAVNGTRLAQVTGDLTRSA